MKQVIKYLIYYYGLIQLIHLSALIYTVSGHEQQVLYTLSPNLTLWQGRVLMLSTYLDLFISAPTALIFVWGYFKKLNWTKIFIDFSLTAAILSAIYYLYTLIRFQAWQWTTLNAFIFIAFLPISLLSSIWLTRKIKHQPLI